MIVNRLIFQLKRFGRDTKGQIAIMFAVSSIMLMTAVGAGIDLQRSFQTFQQLSQVATLTCQYASRPAILQTATSSGTTAYTAKVTTYLTRALSEQNFSGTQSTSTPFTFVSGGAADVSLTTSLPTTFMNIAGIKTLSVSTTAHCFDSPSSIPEHVTDPGAQYLVFEGFEANTPGLSYTFFDPDGTAGATAFSSPQQVFPATVGYTGFNGAQWYIMGYCLETDQVGQIRSSVPEGSRSAELDCDNNQHNAGNSSISTKVYMEAGNYELRYNYALRIYYPEYTYSVICGSTAADVSWATNTVVTGSTPAGQKTNQIYVYLDQNPTAGTPPTHTTLFGSQTLAGSNLIDSCVYADNWVERSVRIKVNTAGFYWLSFAADGLSDSYGGQIDNIRVCKKSCTTALQDNFMSAWTSTNKTLFEDTFESPTYTANYNGNVSTAGNMNNSLGTSGQSTSGWPGQTTRGWATAPYNQMDILSSGSAQGTQSLEMDASTPAPSTRSMTRSFLLVPGYYQLQYRYISDANFSSLGSTVYCGATPSAANIASLSGTGSQTSRVDGLTGTNNKDTNILAVFMSHTQLVSQPIGGGALNSATSYLNPTGTTTAIPTVAPDQLSLTSYNSSQYNPLLDICGYAASWQTRTAYIKITKTNYYQLTFSTTAGTADNLGAAVDDIKLTAQGSLYMSSPPSGAVTIPVPSPQNDTTQTQGGYTMVVDPATPPAAEL